MNIESRPVAGDPPDAGNCLRLGECSVCLTLDAQESKKIGAAPMGPPLTLRNYMLQRARQHTVIYIIGWLSRYFSKKTDCEVFIWQQAYNSWTSIYSSLFEQYHLLVSIRVYSSSDNSMIYFAKTIACCSSRNRFRSVPIFSPYSKTQTMSDSSLGSSSCRFSFHCQC